MAWSAERKKALGIGLTAGGPLLFVGITLLVLFEGWDNPDELWVWLLISLSMVGFVGGLGLLVAGRLDGVLIDFRNKVSLSRFQVVLWTLVILSAWFVVAIVRIPPGAVKQVDEGSQSFANCRAQIIADKAEELDVPNLEGEGNESALEAAKQKASEECVRDRLNIAFPAEVWVALGIATTSLGGAALVKRTKRDNNVLDIKVDTRDEADPDNLREARPEFVDMFRGDTQETHDKIDISKVQMFFFTVILVIGYAAAVGSLLNDSTELLKPLGVDMPDFTASMNVLLGLSHAGYLGIKAAEG